MILGTIAMMPGVVRAGQQDKPAHKMQPAGKSKPAPTETPDATDPAAQLTLKSKWRGDRWNTQNENDPGNPEVTNGTVTLRDGNQVELRTEKFRGPFGSQHWVFAIDGGKLKLVKIYVSQGAPATFEVLESSGTVNGDTLGFTCKYRMKADKINAIYFEKLQLKKMP